MDLEKSKAIKGCWAVSYRILLVQINSRSFDVNIIKKYAPSEDNLCVFCRDLDNAFKKWEKKGIKIILVKCNANIGNEHEFCMGGNYGLAEHNERGDRLVEWTKESIMFVENT